MDTILKQEETPAAAKFGLADGSVFWFAPRVTGFDFLLVH
jgi:hypothetical protein